jgi:hypothetical protein
MEVAEEARVRHPRRGATASGPPIPRDAEPRLTLRSPCIGRRSQDAAAGARRRPRGPQVADGRQERGHRGRGVRKGRVVGDARGDTLGIRDHDARAPRQLEDGERAMRDSRGRGHDENLSVSDVRVSMEMMVVREMVMGALRSSIVRRVSPVFSPFSSCRRWSPPGDSPPKPGVRPPIGPERPRVSILGPRISFHGPRSGRADGRSMPTVGRTRSSRGGSRAVDGRWSSVGRRSLPTVRGSLLTVRRSIPVAHWPRWVDDGSLSPAQAPSRRSVDRDGRPAVGDPRAEYRAPRASERQPPNAERHPRATVREPRPTARDPRSVE